MGHSAWMVSLQDKAQGLLRDRPGPADKGLEVLTSLRVSRQKAPSCGEDSRTYIWQPSPWCKLNPIDRVHLHPLSAMGKPARAQDSCLLTCCEQSSWGRGTPQGPCWKAEGKGFRGFQGTGLFFLVFWKELRAGRLLKVSQTHEATRVNTLPSMWDTSSHLPGSSLAGSTAEDARMPQAGAELHVLGLPGGVQDNLCFPNPPNPARIPCQEAAL